MRIPFTAGHYGPDRTRFVMAHGHPESGPIQGPWQLKAVVRSEPSASEPGEPGPSSQLMGPDRPLRRTRYAASRALNGPLRSPRPLRHG